MRVEHFEATGLTAAEEALAKTDVNGLTADELRSLLKLCSVSFVLEAINRLQSTLICELKDSYVQQSQRYARLGSDGYTLPKLDKADMQAAAELIGRLFGLYERMSELKAGDFKGRLKAEHYLHGIPIEDARYILPLAATTNVAVAMSGDKLVDFFRLCNDKRYDVILGEVKASLAEHLPSRLAQTLQAVSSGAAGRVWPDFYRPYFAQLSDADNMKLLDSFADMDGKVGLGAVTSTRAELPSAVWQGWGENASAKAAGVAARVLGYGHTSIAEQARTMTGMMCSLVTYHQQLRHRLSSNQREELSELLSAVRPLKVPDSIRNSQFAAEFQALADELRALRRHIQAHYGEQAACYLLLNCEQIKLLQSANVRADVAMLSERTCMNAQWEIRELAVKKLRQLRTLSAVLYESALPSCVRGACKEGRMSCGRADEVRRMFADFAADKEGTNAEGR